jgi:pSer/pThr/pTyr-binding forkhead associated (FHA) protein
VTSHAPASLAGIRLIEILGPAPGSGIRPETAAIDVFAGIRSEIIESAAPRITVGRSDVCDVSLDGETVSRVHCEIRRIGSGYIIEDRSRNGTFINGSRIIESPLRDGDRIRIGKHLIEVELPGERSTGTMSARDTAGSENGAGAAVKAGRQRVQVFVSGLEDGVTRQVVAERIRIGRRLENELVLMGDKVSRDHAAIENENGCYSVFDLGSANGTFVNGQRVERSPIAAGDRLRFGSYDCLVSFHGDDCLLQFRRRVG